MKIRHVISAICLLAMAALLTIAAAGNSTTRPANDPGLSAAICPVVYPLDQSSSARGYHYIFYGNAFFINTDGYLITAAHVLSALQEEGQPYLLLRMPEAPPRVLKAEVVSTDLQHDVAILRGVPNPFAGRYQVSYLPLAATKPAPGAAVLAMALRPSRPQDPHSFDAPQEDNCSAEVLQYTSASLSGGLPNSELFLFSHEVIRGQSGAPIVSQNDAGGVVGIVEGRWLHAVAISAQRTTGSRSSTVGAAIPITYAIPLLERGHIVWQAALPEAHFN